MGWASGRRVEVLTADEGTPSSAERERVVAFLCDLYARDRMELAEFERRIEAAHRAPTRSDLMGILREEAVAGVLPQETIARPMRQTELAIWSGRVRKGAWIPALKIRALGFMGAVELDFREVRLPAEPIEIWVGALMGGVQILVSPGIRVETDGFAFLGAFEEDVEGVQEGHPQGRIRVTGFALIGGVEISSRLPGETPSQARRRRKSSSRRPLSP
jgi:hypothetical protein